MTNETLTAYRDAAAAAKAFAKKCSGHTSLTLGISKIVCEDIPTLATAVDELCAEVERLQGDNKRLTENYEMAKRIIHSAGGICRETLP